MRPKMTAMPGGYMTVALSGDIDIAAAPAARAVIAKAADRAVTGVIIDLGEVTFMDAAGLGVLANAFHRTRHLPDGLQLVGVPAHVLRLLSITGLDRRLAVLAAADRSPAADPVAPRLETGAAGGN